ncbi:MAG TPA: HIT family protein [Candidatus Nanoarchaeia archaeon]|nr:HIT family protein [Candidatus Nanoarchaeia archaeon]
MTDCLFCKIIKKEIKSDVIYEDKEFIAFLDINPVNKGHTLIVPKEHFDTFLDLDEKHLDRLMHFVQKMSKAIVKATKSDGFNLLLNNKKAAGQVIDHVHFHIIPRMKDDGLKHWPHKKYENDEAKQIVNEIKSFL